MDLTKRYIDSFANDKKVDVLYMVKHYPEWAANRIQAGEAALEALAEQEARKAPEMPTLEETTTHVNHHWYKDYLPGGETLAILEAYKFIASKIKGE